MKKLVFALLLASLAVGCAPMIGMVAINDVMALTEKWKVQSEISGARARWEIGAENPSPMP